MKKNLLAQLNAEITLLENYGYYKSANILHKKFIREAQSLEPSRDSGPYKQVFDKYFLSAKTNPNQSLINAIRGDGFLLREDQDKLVNYITEMMKNKATIAPPATSAAPAPATQTAKPATTSIEPGPELAGLAPSVSQPQQPQQQVADPSQYLFSNLLNEAKEYLAINDFNNSAIVRNKAMQSSELTQEQKNAWMQEYNILVQNFSGSKLSGGYYSNQQNAINNIVKATQDLSIPYNAQSIAANEKRIIDWFRNPEGPRADSSTLQLLRQISLSAYYNQQNQPQTPLK